VLIDHETAETIAQRGRETSATLEALHDAVQSVVATFSIQFDMDLAPHGEPTEPQPPEIAYGSSIALTSESGGWNLAVMCDERTAIKLTRLMFAMDETEMPSMEDMADALGEIPNVAGGVFKAKRFEAGDPLQVGLPIFMKGRFGFRCRPEGIRALAQRINGNGEYDVQVVLSWRQDEPEGEDTMAVARESEAPAPAAGSLPETVLREAVEAVRLTSEVQLGMPVQAVGQPSLPDPAMAEFGSTIALTRPDGCWNLSLVCDAGTAQRLTRRMFQMEDDGALAMEDVADVLGELANMSGGNLRRMRIEAGEQVQLGLPLFLEGCGCVEFFASGIQRLAQTVQAADGTTIQVVLIWQGDGAAAAASQPAAGTVADQAGPATEADVPAEEASTEAEETAGLCLPRARNVVDFLELLIGHRPEMTKVESGLDLGYPGVKTYVTYLKDANGHALGAILADLPGTLYLGGGLIMMQPSVLQEQLVEGAASEAVLDALAEIFNNLRGLYNKIMGNQHVSPSPITSFAGAEEDEGLAWMLAPSSRLDLAGNSPYGPGHLVLLGR
jgi:CheY-specific phosphatase CheX